MHTLLRDLLTLAIWFLAFCAVGGLVAVYGLVFGPF